MKVTSQIPRICMHRKRINISTVLPGQKLGNKKVDDEIVAAIFSRDFLAALGERFEVAGESEPREAYPNRRITGSRVSYFPSQ